MSEFGIGFHHELPLTDNDLVYWLAEDEKLYFARRSDYNSTVKEVLVNDLRADMINLSRLLVKPELEFKLRTTNELVGFRKANSITYMIFEGAREFSADNIHYSLGIFKGYYELYFKGDYKSDILPLVK
ncbi:hypothetical protein GF352_04720 [archaeon]|nr:hypothetical protein [archaeon]